MSDFLRNTALVGLTSLGLLWSGAAFALDEPIDKIQPPPAGSLLSGVEVSVPKVIERTRYGVTTTEISMSVHVPYGDLDMRTPGGVKALDKRVAEAATYLCVQLERIYPDGSPERSDCARRAIGDAQPQVILASAPR